THLQIVPPLLAPKTTPPQHNTHQLAPPSTHFHKPIPIIIHPHPPYPPQPINFQTMNLGTLKRYSTPPSLHIIT
ncbi:hypothetical protein, partial [Staphylococcus epidermidis]|uniref:hypothetical protein n=1 Tax=Staphylococcus epidermidis TaxID=1282 RepID=UPI0021B34D1F